MRRLDKTADYDANERRTDRSEYRDRQPCIRCGRPVNTETCQWVHLLVTGHLVGPAEEYASEDSQGIFPIGPKCAKKWPDVVGW